MNNGNGSQDKPPVSYNIIKNRGDPTTATTLTGHRVEKKDFVILPNPMDSAGYASQPMMLRCADYHNEHFVYIDPLFEVDLPKSEKRNFWFAMCTCGAPAGIISPSDANIHNDVSLVGRLTGKGTNESLLVCQHYYQMVLMHGHGFHVGQDPRPWR